MRSTTHLAIRVAAAIAMSAAACIAGYWEFEQVDSGSLGSYVAIDKMSDGTIWLAYVNRNSAVRLAHKDSVWVYEDLDTALVRPPFSFDIGAGDVIGVVGSGRLAERRDSVWSSEALPMSGGILSYDPASRPSLTFRALVDSVDNVCLALRTDSSWDISVVRAVPPYPLLRLSRAYWRQHGDCALMVAVTWGELIQQYFVALHRRDDGIWTERGLAGGLDGGGCGFAALADTSDSIHTFWSASDRWTNVLVCDDFVLDSFAGIGAACLDDHGRMQCVWARAGRLKFAIQAGSPRLDTGCSVEWCDITTDTLSEPAIAFCRSDGAIWVAHGVGIVGLSEEQGWPAVRSLPRAVTIVSGVLVLGELGTRSELPGRNSVMSRAVLLDISGRKVMDLHLGANDVSSVAPGVYFVVTPSPSSSPPEGERAWVRGRAASATKVVITR